MKFNLTLIGTFAGSLALVAACATAPAPTNTAKTTSSPAANKSKSTPKATTADPAAAAKKKGVPDAVTVPVDWDYYTDTDKGYEFKMPKDAKLTDASEAGYDVWDYTSGDVLAEIIAYNNKSLTKDDLFKDAEKFSKETGEKDFTLTNKKELNGDYSTADYTLTDKNGKKRQGRILVATDVSDNYIFAVETDADKFAANSKTIDEILSSFAMYSGGASGGSK